ncbi:hypothetical protein AB6A40_001312 [Gnathostoma spinigerum]|uniref:Malectin domain-containing protein n=1 Tax=Gnathostoma spinigerum TaxID=75299 RepID=A0ABD6E3V7_9BILA
MHLDIVFLPLLLFLDTIFGSENVYLGGSVFYAINCGGQFHVDTYGIRYQSDPLRTGIASDYGNRFAILRVPPVDAILYQTERYHTEDFTYEIPTPEDGLYTLVLKFSEVYFHGRGQKVFNVLLNDEAVLWDFDIWERAGGSGIAYDEAIEFQLSNGILTFNGKSMESKSYLRLTFAKGSYDNPKINAFYVYRGPKSDIPPLPDAPSETEGEAEEEVEDTEPATPSDSSRFAEGPPAPDPYAEQDSSHMFIPILIALACFFPILFCLCKI